ncbi:S-adenosyl-L-methionine-dependent methyltransferase [Mycena pura]|uniref:S-adenosyl-L-methionine-dependent methyltransferase n=1 Tax=Mycena pura TaxID=153505 RepID=A0AAD6Y6R8_9AGAR|nr:S-adenosyl-L-methionine-dependent methyltransferase [Mycena pura]
MASKLKPDFAKFSPEGTAKMEEITGTPAHAMLVQAGLLPTPPVGARVLDNACGGGVVAARLFGAIGPGTTTDLHVVCGDLAEYMVKSAAERIEKHSWNAEAKVVDAQARELECLPDNHFTHTLMNFGIQFIPNNVLAVEESFRVLRPEGTIGFTSWTAPGWLDSFKHGVPGFVEPPFLKSAPTATEESITGLLTGAGFTRVNVQPIVFEQTDTMARCLPFLGEAFKTILVGETKAKYEAYMKERYGEGEFTLTWKAFVVTAVKP